MRGTFLVSSSVDSGGARRGIYLIFFIHNRNPMAYLDGLVSISKVNQLFSYGGGVFS